jgi:hypothetical protein
MSDELQNPSESSQSPAAPDPASSNESTPANTAPHTESSAASTAESQQSSDEPGMESPGALPSMTEDVAKGQDVVTAEEARLPEGLEQGQAASGAKERRNDRPKDQNRSSKDRTGQKKGRRDKSPNAARPKRPSTREIKKFVVVTWSSQREPVDNMYWAEAERQGDWIVVNALEQVRTRREVLERIQELQNGLVALEFNFSFPQPFLEHVRQEIGATDWRGVIKRVREDLKRNAEDGIRLWVERMGKYREANLEPEEETVARMEQRQSYRRNDNRSENRGSFRGDPRFRGREPLEPHERRSTAERFRRTDLTLRRAAENHLVSPIQIAYNRLTSRYEFNDPNVRGRGALLGMSMIDQLLEANSEIAIWPFAKQKAVTLVELQPWIFTKGKSMPADAVRRMIALHEDAGWDIPSNVRDAAARNPDAQRAFLSLMGVIKTENREDRANRPLRDYQDTFYSDAQVQQEGWFYGVGYRSAERPTEGSSTKKDDRNAGRRPAKERPEGAAKKEDKTSPEQGTASTTSDVSLPTSPHEVAPSENPIVNESSALEVETFKEMVAADVQPAGESGSEVGSHNS